MPLNATATGILQSLGWAILHSFWQMALIWLVYFLFFGWHRRFSPALKHNAALVCLTIGTVWFLATFSNEYTKYLQVGRYLLSIPDVNGSTSYENGFAGSMWGLNLLLRDFAERNIAWLSAAYLLITTLTAWKLLFSIWVVQQLKIKGIQPAGAQIDQWTDALANQLHIHPKVRTFISERVDVPATFGYLKPVILLPAAALAQLSPAQLESVIIHELAHIRRADYLVNILVSVMETILVHNPFAWLLARSIRTERELCCDDVVLSRKQDILSYASALLALEKNRHVSQYTLALASNGQKGQLLARIERMVEPGRFNPAGTHRLIGIVFMGLLFVLMAWAIPGTTVAETRKEIIIEQQPGYMLKEKQTAELSYMPEYEDVQIEKRKKDTKKIEPIEETWERVYQLEPFALETPMAEPMPLFPDPAEEPSFHFSFQEQDPARAFRPIDPGEEELLKLIERSEKLRARYPASREERMMLVDDAFEGFAELSPDALIEIQKQEWGQLAQRAKILHQEQILNQQKLAERYKAPMVIYRNEARKATAPGAIQKTRVRPPATETMIRKMKTADGYILRIETGAQSIDIRIAEDDLVVEGNGEHR